MTATLMIPAEKDARDAGRYPLEELGERAAALAAALREAWAEAVTARAGVALLGACDPSATLDRVRLLARRVAEAAEPLGARS